MQETLQTSASIEGGSLQLSIYRVKDNVLLGRINNQGKINVALDDEEKYVIIYHVFAKNDGCSYEVEITSPSQAKVKIQLKLQLSGDVDYNSIPFHT